MDNHLAMDKIAMFLSHSDLKLCRFVSKFWNDIMRRELSIRKSSCVLLNPKTATSLLEYDKIFCDSVELEWEFEDSLTTPKNTNFDLNKFFLKFGKHIKYLQWSGADLADMYMDHRRRHKSYYNEGSFGQLLYCVPNLQELSFGNIDGPICPDRYKICRPVADGLLWMKSLKLKHLTTLNFGHNVHLSAEDICHIIAHHFQLKRFTFIGREIRWRSGEPMTDLLNSWRDTLEYLRIRSSPAFKLLPMPVLKALVVESTFGLIEPLPILEQFPALEKLAQKFDPDFDWNAFVPDGMLPHLKLKVLEISEESYNRFATPNFIRLLAKCPNLKSLSTARVNDDVTRVIFEHLQGLESLTMHASFSSETFTGVPVVENYEKYSFHYTEKFESIFAEITSKSSIQNLQNLHRLKITGSDGIGIISDHSVLHGISKLEKLRTLTLPDGISDKSLELIALFPELRELNLQAPLENRKLTWGGINCLRSSRPNLIISVTNRKHNSTLPY